MIKFSILQLMLLSRNESSRNNNKLKKAVRMQKQKLVNQSIDLRKIVTVMANQNIRLMAPNGFQICILEGTEMLLDVNEMIAKYENYHFDVSSDEISVTQ
jgi:hypothetical protein